MAVLVEPDHDGEIPHRTSTLVHADQIADMLQIRVEAQISVDEGSDVRPAPLHAGLSHAVSKLNSRHAS